MQWTLRQAQDRRVGFCRIYKHFSGFEFSLLSSIVYARPSASIPLGKITLGDDDANR